MQRHKPSGSPIVLISAALILALLYFARVVLIPLALSVLLSFLLAPAVIRLQRWRLGRVPAVVVVTFLSFALIGALGWLVVGQALEVAGQLPEYKANIRQKAESLRFRRDSALVRATDTVKEIQADLTTPTTGPSTTQKGIPVEIVQPRMGAIEELSPTLAALIAPTGTAGVVMVFVFFMLLQREDLRDRAISLIGAGPNVTTQALDDAAKRISRYILMQSTINAIHGVTVGLGLSLLGLPNALLWGLLSALLRFVPYLGPVIAASLPITLALAIFDGWTRPLLTVGFFFVLELVSNNLLEPWLYGSSTGISPFAILVSAVFWTSLWGGVGLFLATPLTVCLVVLGKHVPQLWFLNTLLGDEPVLEPKARYYQRLLALDQEEATDLADEYLKEHTLEELYDDVMLPALRLAEIDRHRGYLEEHRARFIRESTNEIVAELGERQNAGASADPAADGDSRPAALDQVSILCLPARDDADETGARMLAQLLAARGIRAESISVTSLAGEMVDLVAKHKADIVCISALPPSAIAHARYLIKRLRLRYSDLRLLVGSWDSKIDPGKAAGRLKDCGPVEIATTLAAAQRKIEQWVPGVRQSVAQPGPHDD